MGLWLKQDDGSLVPVGGGGSGGGEVLTGDPQNPPADWAAGQLLYDGWEDTGDGSEPHDHAEYLPLAGGTLDPGAQIKTYGTNSTAPAYSFASNTGCGMYLANGVEGIVGLSGELWVSERLRAPSLQVDGTIEMEGKTVATTDQIQNLEYWDYQIPDANADGSVHEEKIIWPGFGGGGVGLLVSVVGIGENNNGLIVESWGHAGWDGSGIMVKYRTQHGVAPRRGVLRFWSLTSFFGSRSDNETLTGLLTRVEELSAEIEELKKGA